VQKRIDKLMAGEEDDESTTAVAEPSKSNGVSAATNGTTAPAAENPAAPKVDPELEEMKAMAAEDGSAEESNTGMSR
jgi:hypothetical protein